MLIELHSLCQKDSWVLELNRWEFALICFIVLIYLAIFLTESIKSYRTKFLNFQLLVALWAAPQQEPLAVAGSMHI